MLPREQFAQLIREGILSLPQDLKTMLRIVDDPEMDDESRMQAAGALLHVLSASNAIPGLRGALSYADDVLVIRLVLEDIKKRSPDALNGHYDGAQELLEKLDEQIGIIRRYLGDSTRLLDKVVTNVSKTNHQGHSAKSCVFDTDGSNWLYDTVNEALVNEFEIDEDDLIRSTKNVEEVLNLMQLHAAKK